MTWMKILDQRVKFFLRQKYFSLIFLLIEHFKKKNAYKFLVLWNVLLIHFGSTPTELTIVKLLWENDDGMMEIEKVMASFLWIYQGMCQILREILFLNHWTMWWSSFFPFIFPFLNMI